MSRTRLFLRHSLVCFVLTSLVFVGCDKQDKPNDESKPDKFNESYFGALSDELTSDLVYSKAVYLERNAVMQCFDIDNNGDIYYVQLAGNDQHKLHVLKGQPNQTNPNEMMTLEYFGHGTNMAVEQDGDDAYVWIGSHGSKSSNGSYNANQTISRIKFEDGKELTHSGEELYYFEGAKTVYPAVNADKNIFALSYTYTTSGVTARAFYVYKLSDVKALEAEEVTIKSIKTGGGYSSDPETTQDMTVMAKVVSNLKPLYNFVISSGFYDTGYAVVGSDLFQGYDADENFIYFYEGSGNNNVVENPSNAVVSVLDKKGLLSARAKVAAITDAEALDAMGMADRGYMEAEGIKVKDGVLYLGFASRKIDGDDKRLANILKYAGN